MKRRHAATLGASLLVCGLAPAIAPAATYTDMRLLSATSLVQANLGSNAVTLTADGRYAVLFTAATNLFPDPAPAGETRTTPVLRYDLDAPGSAPELVAYDSSTRLGGLNSATVPSISADGRWIAFTTDEPLTADDRNGVGDVYVRDMSVPISDPSAYVLASAQDGSATTPIAYTRFEGGAISTAHALSADGSRVVFTVSASATIGGVKTAKRQTVVRDLDRLETRIVSLGTTGKPVGDQGRNVGSSQPSPRISADGSTVAWNSAWVWGTPSVPGLLPTPEFLSPFNAVAVWRRLADSPLPPVRLILTPADPEDPACTTVVLSTSLVPGPCDSPTQVSGVVSQDRVTPMALSANGRRAAVVTGNPRIGGPSTNIDAFDAYIVDMSDGVSRKQGTRRISFGPDGTSSANVTDIGLSPDGRYVVFTASALVPSTSPAPIGEFPPPNGPARLYLVDLERDTIELVGRNWSGGDLTGTISKPTVSNDGRRIAFLSDATDLFFGDSNSATDAVVLTRATATQEQEEQAETATTVPSALPPARPIDALAPDQRLTVTAIRRTNGQVLVDVTVPGAGTVSVEARERRVVRTSTAKRTRIARRVASDATARSTGVGKVRLVLDPKRSFLRQARRAGGVPATITVRFTPAAGGPALTKTRSVSFRRAKAATTSTRTTR